MSLRPWLLCLLLLGVVLGFLQQYQIPFNRLGLSKVGKGLDGSALKFACAQQDLKALLSEECTNISSNTRNAAVIVETREHQMLPYVVANMASSLPDDWIIYLFHGNENSHFVRSLPELQKFHQLGRLELVSLRDSARRFQEMVQSKRGFYNCLLKSPEFWSCSAAESILIFQTDSVLCGASPYEINDFLSYDYIGAPWPDGHVGNGGLSLRRRKKMLELTQRKWLKVEPEAEDLFFSKAGNQSHFHWAPLEQAQRFSTDNLYNESVGA